MDGLNRNADGFGQNDLLKPEIRLCQKTSGDKATAAGAKPGQFYNVISGESYPAGFEMVILDINKTRTFWGTTEISDSPPVCASEDANSYESVNGADCHKCLHLCDNAAMVDAKARREKCTIGWTLHAMMLPNLDPFTIRATGISATPVMSLLTAMFYNKAARNPKDKSKIDWHRFKIPVSSSEQDTPFGKAYACKFGQVTPFGDSKFEEQVYTMSAILLGQGDILKLNEGAAPPANNQALPPGEKSATGPAAPPPATQGTLPKVRTVGEKTTPPVQKATEAPPASESKQETKTTTSKKPIDMDV